MKIIEEYVIPNLGRMRIYEGEDGNYFSTFKPMDKNKSEFQIRKDENKGLVKVCGEYYLKGRYSDELDLMLGKDKEKLWNNTWLDEYKTHSKVGGNE